MKQRAKPLCNSFLHYLSILCYLHHTSPAISLNHTRITASAIKRLPIRTCAWVTMSKCVSTLSHPHIIYCDSPTWQSEITADPLFHPQAYIGILYRQKTRKILSAFHPSASANLRILQGWIWSIYLGKRILSVSGCTVNFGRNYIKSSGLLCWILERLGVDHFFIGASC